MPFTKLVESRVEPFLDSFQKLSEQNVIRLFFNPRCSHAKLTEIPRDIPRETSELYLDVNQITKIHPERITHLNGLTRLYVCEELLYFLATEQSNPLIQ